MKNNVLNIDDLNCPVFRELVYAVKDFNKSKIDSWFENQNLSTKLVLSKKICLRILNTPFFFSFSSTSTNKKEIEECRTKREVEVLKHFSLENQLLLLSVACIEDVNVKHIEVLKITKSKKKMISSNSKIIAIITKLFNEENFDELEKIQNKLDFNIMDMKGSQGSFHYKSKSSHGSFSIKFDEDIFSPKYELIINYSDAKANFLKNKNIELPNLENIDILFNKIMKAISISTNNSSEHISKVESSFKEYIVKKRYAILNEDLKVNEIISGSKRGIKI
ncbi:hypothetical protein GW796_08710 [archaeon]|nr:hypothetical protein [archaeon]NCQ51959.1 hypothetical protein [archaeon]